jgi:hypothetical protein
MTQLRLSQITTLVDPKKQLCHFEVPGGGECRDAECEDVHLDRLVLAPSGASAARHGNLQIPDTSLSVLRVLAGLGPRDLCAWAAR